MTQRLASIAQSQIQNIGTSSWAAMAELYGQGDFARFNQRALKLTRLVAIASLTLLIPIAAFNETFVELWVGPDLHGGLSVTLAAVLVAFAQSVVSLWRWFFHAAGLIPKVVPVAIATVIVNLVGSIICVRMFGIVGPLLGTLLSLVVVASWALPLLMRRTFGLSVARLVAAVAWPVVVSLPVMGVSAFVSTQPFLHTWLGWLVATTVTAATFLLTAWMFLLDRKARLEWRGRLQTALTILRR